MLILSNKSLRTRRNVLIGLITTLSCVNICVWFSHPDTKETKETSKVAYAKVIDKDLYKVSIGDRYSTDIAISNITNTPTPTAVSTTPSSTLNPTKEAAAPTPVEKIEVTSAPTNVVLATTKPLVQAIPKVATASDAAPVTKYGVFDTVGYVPTEQEMMMFCAVVSSETGYCADQVQKAVAHTIINRILSPKFPDNLYAALTQRNQYTAVNCYFTGAYRPGLYPGSERWDHTMNVIYEALNEYDFTNGAFAYYNPHMLGYNAWFESLIFTYEDQYGRFFKF